MIFANKYPQRVVLKILTKLLPTKIVESALSKCSCIYKAFLEPLTFSSAKVLIRILLEDEKAISLAEKKAEKIKSKIIPIIVKMFVTVKNCADNKSEFIVKI